MGLRVKLHLPLSYRNDYTVFVRGNMLLKSRMIPCSVLMSNFDRYARRILRPVHS